MELANALYCHSCDFHPEQGLMKINYEHAAFTDPSLLCQGVHIVDLHSALQSTRETTCVYIHGGSLYPLAVPLYK